MMIMLKTMIIIVVLNIDDDNDGDDDYSCFDVDDANDESNDQINICWKKEKTRKF